MPHTVQTTRALLQRPFISALPPQKIQVRCNSGSFFMRPYGKRRIVNWKEK